MRASPLLALLAVVALATHAAPHPHSSAKDVRVVARYGFDDSAISLAVAKGSHLVIAQDSHDATTAASSASPFVVDARKLAKGLARQVGAVTAAIDDATASATLVVLTRERFAHDDPAHEGALNAKWQARTWRSARTVARLAAASLSSSVAPAMSDISISKDAYHIHFEPAHATLPGTPGVAPLYSAHGTLVLAVSDLLRVPLGGSSSGVRASDAIADAAPRNARVVQVPLADLLERAQFADVDEHQERAREHVARVAQQLIQRASGSAQDAKDPDDDEGGDEQMREVLAQINTKEIRKDLRWLTGEDKKSPITSRHAMSEGHIKAAAWVRAKMEAAGCDSVEYHYFRDNYGPNVICTFKGASIPDEEVILSSHLDSRGSLFVPFARAPGADDDGSGSAMLLSALKHFAASEFRGKLKRTVRFISWSGEEEGLVGSMAYAKAARQRGDKITFMLQADMLGYHAKGEPMQLAVPAAHASPEANMIVSAVAREYAPNLVIGETKACCSDHQSFFQVGYLSTQIFERNGPIADPMYHNRGDLTERPGFDFDQIVEHTKVALATVISVAETVDDQSSGRPHSE